MLGQYINKQMKFSVDLMPFYENLEEPTVSRLAEIRDANDAFEVEVYAKRIKKYRDITQVLEDNRREMHYLI